MSEPVRYLTNEQGERVGVLLDLELYNRLKHPLASDADCLIGLSPQELQALAKAKLAIAEQSRIDELIAKNTEAQLSTAEAAELDALLTQADQLTVLKTRAIYTLKRLEETANAS